MKLRNFAVVVFSGFLTGVGLAIHKGAVVNVLNHEISAGILFATAGLIATQLIHFMDTYWYHVFLKGAVSTSSSIENEIKDILKVDELSKGISSSSQAVCIVSIFGIIHLPIGWKKWLGPCFIFRKVVVDSTMRHKIFYRWLLTIFFIIGLFCFALPTPQDTKPPAVNQETSEKTSQNLLSKHKSFISANNVRIRTSPNLKAEIIKILPQGKVVATLKKSKDNQWVKVSYETKDNSNHIGWVHSDLITRLK